jgi:hypothetical protein
MVADQGTLYGIFETAWSTRAAIGLRILDGANTSTGVKGLVGDFNVIGFKRTEPMDGVITVSVSAKLTYSATAPTWATAPLTT